MRRPTRMTIGWFIVIGGGVTWELLAIFDHTPGGTLSELTWDFLNIHPIVWFISLGIALWVGVHFFQRTWRRP